MYDFAMLQTSLELTIDEIIFIGGGTEEGEPGEGGPGGWNN